MGQPTVEDFCVALPRRKAQLYVSACERGRLLRKYVRSKRPKRIVNGKLQHANNSATHDSITLHRDNLKRIKKRKKNVLRFAMYFFFTREARVANSI